MAKVRGNPLVNCPHCQQAIGDEHHRIWCTACGNNLPREVLEQIPGLRAELQRLDQEAAARAAAAASEVPDSEGRNAKFLGRALGWVTVVGAVVCVVGSGFDPFWMLLALGGTLNGLFFGYLLSKVGSILLHLERQQGAAAPAAPAGEG